MGLSGENPMQQAARAWEGRGRESASRHPCRKRSRPAQAFRGLLTGAVRNTPHRCDQSVLPAAVADPRRR